MAQSHNGLMWSSMGLISSWVQYYHYSTSVELKWNLGMGLVCPAIVGQTSETAPSDLPSGTAICLMALHAVGLLQEQRYVYYKYMRKSDYMLL